MPVCIVAAIHRKFPHFQTTGELTIWIFGWIKTTLKLKTAWQRKQHSSILRRTQWKPFRNELIHPTNIYSLPNMDRQEVWHWRYDSELDRRVFFNEMGWLEICLGGPWFVNKYWYQDSSVACFVFSEKGNMAVQIPIDDCSLLVLWYSVNVLYALSRSPYPIAPLITVHMTHSNFLHLPLVCISPLSSSLIVCLCLFLYHENCLLLYHENWSQWICTLPTLLFATFKPV